MGTPLFATVCLKRLIEENINIVAVVTVPDKPLGRGLKVKPSPVKQEALAARIPVLQPENLRDPEFLSRIDEFEPDLFIIVAFRILPEDLFTKAGKGAVNLHGSLLPKYRGAAPINWAIINGEQETGITTFFLKKRVDTGNIIAQKKIIILPDMTAGKLHDIMAVQGANLLIKTIQMLKSGKVKTIAQDESIISKAPKINPGDCLINFNQPVENVHNFIRGLSPKPGAYTFLKNNRIHFYRSDVSDPQKKTAEPGTAVSGGDLNSLYIQCEPGCLEIKEIKPEGKRRMSVAEYRRGHDLPVGTVFTQLII
jgi:methionyl-tRNA formyltransferase